MNRHIFLVKMARHPDAVVVTTGHTVDESFGFRIEHKPIIEHLIEGFPLWFSRFDDSDRIVLEVDCKAATTHFQIGVKAQQKEFACP